MASAGVQIAQRPGAPESLIELLEMAKTAQPAKDAARLQAKDKKVRQRSHVEVLGNSEQELTRCAAAQPSMDPG